MDAYAGDSTDESASLSGFPGMSLAGLCLERFLETRTLALFMHVHIL